MEEKVMRTIYVPTNSDRDIKVNLVKDNSYGKTTIRIDIKGVKLVNAGCTDETKIPRQIWEMYQRFHMGDRVARSGNYLCGVYTKPADPSDFDYIENDTIHASSCEELAHDILRFYPELIEEHLRGRIIQFLRYHDLGELLVGDRPDDGSCNKADKVLEELETFCVAINVLPVESQEVLIRDFILFEYALSPEELLPGVNGDWSEDDGRAMQFAKLCDKADAVLHALVYEIEDRPGDLQHKILHFNGITEQDQYYINEIKSSLQADVWAAHFFDRYNEYYAFRLFFEIILEAFRSVRGSLPSWVEPFCIKRNILY